MATKRGPHPADRSLFSKAQLPALREATADLSWLVGRGYPRRSSLELVGNRYRLRERQRVAIGRAACGEEQAKRRRSKLVETAQVLWIDGFNLLTTLEAALSGGVILYCRDGAVRDMASMHGSYRRVAQTERALELLLPYSAGTTLVWYFDKPVSNSGRLAQMLREFADEHQVDWKVELVPDPDPVLKESPHPVVSSDSAILDQAERWRNLTAEIIDALSDVWLVDLR